MWVTYTSLTLKLPQQKIHFLKKQQKIGVFKITLEQILIRTSGMNLKKKTLVFLIITKGDHKGTGQAELGQLVALVSLPVLPHHLGQSWLEMDRQPFLPSLPLSLYSFSFSQSPNLIGKMKTMDRDIIPERSFFLFQ